MTDNFKLIKDFIQSQWGGQFDLFNNVFYMIEIIGRNKDNTAIQSHKFKTYYVRTMGDFDKYEQEIKTICDVLQMRAYISVNHKSMKHVTLNTMAEYANRIAQENFDKPYSVFDSCSAKYVERSEQLWIIDVDKEDADHYSLNTPMTVDDLVDLYIIRYSEPPVSLAATTRYIRALLNYYDKWGGSSLFSRIKELSGKIFSSGEQTTYRPADQLAIPTPEPVTEKSLITPIPEQPEEDPEKMVALSGIELGGLDLEALRRATVLWSEYKEKYESLVEMVKGGKISQDLPLYAWMYSEESGYMYYTGSSGEVDLVSSLRVMVYLAEIGQLDKEGYAWVSQQIYNAGVLYESYDVISGYAISEKEAYEAYPLVLYLALIKGDEDLFSVTYNVMMRNYATLSTSTALYAFFRDVEDSRIAVYARENLLMELILR